MEKQSEMNESKKTMVIDIPVGNSISSSDDQNIDKQIESLMKEYKRQKKAYRAAIKLSHIVKTPRYRFNETPPITSPLLKPVNQ